ncbi:ribbon-helix-helix protein, CopG family [Geobacter benzoatilyticus]|uniref:Ribbon-helix-helix protein, CopG family n=1 Tax=Geobacter benzoatilyticus TaxID=2815309 RepID=A0ABX7Q2X7_9BACT|nr:ribbon-helix-helix protein, CopG family [Geobacter benzoatilyticus]QSV45749.1 ribbon-helix-helix protein, CopG family [Geobacter benzoatilyticus]
MGKTLYETARPTVISVRVADDQMEVIRRLMEKKKMSASDIMREAFHVLVENAERKRMDAIRAAAVKYTGARVDAALDAHQCA